MSDDDEFHECRQAVKRYLTCFGMPGPEYLESTAERVVKNFLKSRQG